MAQNDESHREKWLERRRILGLVLHAYALAHLAGDFQTARVLDELATEIEHS